MTDQSQGPGWWLANDGKWYPPQQAQAPQRVCVRCSSPALVPHEKKITSKKRVKFGIFWVLFTILTGGLAIILWLVMPRRSVVVGVDRWVQCSNCRARQP